MKYLIWRNDKDNSKLLNVLLTNHSFAEVFDGGNPLHPVGGAIEMGQKKYRITKFERMEDMVEVGVEMVEGVSEAVG